MSNAIGFLIIIGTVVTIHELGHFLAAKFCGVGVLKFSIGFGPKLFSFKRKGTEYIIASIPLGGYVRMVGDMPDLITGPQATDNEIRAETEGKIVDNGIVVEELDPEVKALIADSSKWFIHKSYWQRSLIVFAGPLFNFILAYGIAVGIALGYGLMDVDGTRLGSVLSGSPADRAGLKQGDVVIMVDQTLVKDFSEVQKLINGSQGKDLTFTVQRGAEKLTLVATPQKKSMDIPGVGKTENFMIGITVGTTYKDASLSEAFIHSFVWLFHLGYTTLEGIIGLVSGSVPLDSIGGPIMIYEIAGVKAQQGLADFLGLLAYINLSLGLLNLMPIPVLDGGHLLIFSIEAIFGKISTKKKEFVQAIGMIALFAMMILAFSNDLTRDTKKMIEQSEPRWENSTQNE